MTHRTLVALAAAAAFGATGLFAQDRRQHLAGTTDLSQALHRLVTNESLAGARIGLHVVRMAADGSFKTIAQHRENDGCVTASNMKLITSAVALQSLGPDYRFTTRLVATGPIENGVLDGDLVLVGSGDPSFGGRGEKNPTDVFERMLESAFEVSGGLHRITGRVLGDDNSLPDETMGEGWAWNDTGASYAAQMSGLCFAENCVRLTAHPTAAGEPLQIILHPQQASGYVHLTDLRTTTLASTDSSAPPTRLLRVDRHRARNELVVRGRVSIGARPATRSASIENPTAYAAWVLDAMLRARGVEIGGSPADCDDELPNAERFGDERVLAQHHSAPLKDLIKIINTASQNLYAEQVLRVSARDYGGDGNSQGSMRAAAAHAREVLEKLGVTPHGMAIADGSGLSRLNLVRARHFTELLVGMVKSPHGVDFRESLPAAGIDGTLSNRFTNSPATGIVRAKSGYIRRVVSLSGYVSPDNNAESRPTAAFSILINDFTCPTSAATTAIDTFVETVVAVVQR